MIRFIVAPEGALVPDLAERLPGRGIWLRADRSAIEASIDGRAFARAARRAVRVSPCLVLDLETMLRRRCIDDLGLARRAGALVAGFDQVVEALQKGRVGLLVVANDASTGQRRRLTPLAGGLPFVDCLSREEVGGAIGREDVTYAAVSAGKLAQRLERDMRRLAGVLGHLPSEGPGRPEAEDEAELAGGEPNSGEEVESPSIEETREPAGSASVMIGHEAGRDNEDDDAA